jgi:hypothetical protein
VPTFHRNHVGYHGSSIIAPARRGDHLLVSQDCSPAASVWLIRRR